MDAGLLLLRVVVGLVFIGHGTQKLFGWYGGGPRGTAGMFGSLGFRRPVAMAIMAGLTESLSGSLLVLGFLQPLAAAGIVGMMVAAVGSVHAPNGPWVSNGGYEYNVVLMAAALALVAIGPGLYSLGDLTGVVLNGTGWALAAFFAGSAAGLGVLASRRAPAMAGPAREATRTAP